MYEATAISRAAAHVGSQSALARQIGVSQGLVWQWIAGRLSVPAERCVDIERATGGAVTRADLRPDIFGDLEDRDVA